MDGALLFISGVDEVVPMNGQYTEASHFNELVKEVIICEITAGEESKY